MKSSFQKINVSIALLALLVTASCSSLPARPDPPLQVVPKVDLERYLGTWYEIARYPHSFEENCYAVTAEYKKLEDGWIQVVNRCREGAVDGPLRSAEGKAYVEDTQTNAQLKVAFFWPFYGNYWIIELDKNYQYAVVSEPGRQYLWILSRQPQMDADTYNKLTEKIKGWGFDLSLLTLTPQSSD